MDELEWPREDKKLTAEERERSIDELIGLVGAVDGIPQAQSAADAEYFLGASGAKLHTEEVETVRAGVLNAYRRQYIFSGVDHPRYQAALGNLIVEAQAKRISEVLSPLRN